MPDIDQAPSPSDIASADERVGRVDFNRRLGTRRVREEREDGEDAHLLILPPAKVEAILAAENAKLEAETEPDVVEAPAPRALREADADADVDLGRSVEDVAASVIASMRATAGAHRRHLEAIEAEAARRGELHLAQAELDAELIRLTGRREAHRIIATARARTGEEVGDTPSEASRLQEIGETFSRFAESIESTAAYPPPSDPGTT